MLLVHRDAVSFQQKSNAARIQAKKVGCKQNDGLAFMLNKMLHVLKPDAPSQTRLRPKLNLKTLQKRSAVEIKMLFCYGYTLFFRPVGKTSAQVHERNLSTVMTKRIRQTAHQGSGCQQEPAWAEGDQPKGP